MPLPACLLHCNGGHVEIGLAPRPKNTTTAAGCGRTCHGCQCRGHRILRVAGRGGGGRRSPAYRPVPRGRIMVATPMLRVVVAAASVFPWHPRAYARHRGAGRHCGRRRRSPGKRNLCQHGTRSHRRAPPPAPPGCPAAGGCGSGWLGRAIAELAGWHDIDMAPMDLPGACDVQKS